MSSVVTSTPASGPGIEKLPQRSAAFALLVAMGILLSRVAGLIRQRVFAHYFGNGPAGGAFTAALRIPNFLQNLLGEGVLSASFIPVYARLLAEGEKELAAKVASVIASLLALVTSIIVVIGVIAAPLLVDWIAPGFHGQVRALTIDIVRILFPGTGLLVLSAWCLGVLNSHKKFFLAYAAPVLWSGAMIATLMIFGRQYGQWPLATALAWGTVVGSFLQFAVQLPMVFRYSGRLGLSFSTALAPVREIIRNFVPSVVRGGVVQISGFIDMAIASLLGTAAVTGIFYAQTIYMLPISLFGMSVAASELPQMSSEIGNQEEIYARLRERLQRGLRQVAFFVVPTVVAFILIGREMVAALFQTGNFRANDAAFVWFILIGSTVGLLAATQGRLYSSAFFALRDTRKPFRFALIRIVISASLAYMVAVPFRSFFIDLLSSLTEGRLPIVQGGLISLGAVGLTAASGIGAWVEFLLLRREMEKRIGPARLAPSYMARLWIASVSAGLCALYAVAPVAVIVRQYAPRSMTHIAIAAVVATIFGTIYFGAAALLKVEEVRSVTSRFRRR